MIGVRCKNLWLTDCPSNIPISVSFISYPKKILCTKEKLKISIFEKIMDKFSIFLFTLLEDYSD